MAQELAVKIIMNKKLEAGLPEGVSEDEIRKQVMKEVKSDVNQRMDKMIENIRRYRKEFGGSRMPTFLMNKVQLENHRKHLRRA